MIKALVSALASFALVASVAATELVPLAVVDAKSTYDTLTGAPVVEITLSEEGQAAFAKFSGENVGKRVDVLVDDDVITSPVIHTPLYMQVMQLSGLETMAMATEIATRLRGKKAQVFVRPAKD